MYKLYMDKNCKRGMNNRGEKVKRGIKGITGTRRQGGKTTTHDTLTKERKK